MSNSRRGPSAREKVALARCRLLQKEPFFGYLMNFFRTRRTPNGLELKTAAVWIDGEGQPAFSYNPDFIDGLTVAETVVILRHELDHILRLHPLRMLAWGKDAYRNHGPLNWAMDALIHGHRDNPFLEGLAASKRLMKSSVFLPPDIPETATLEQLVGKMPKMTVEELLKMVFGLKELKFVRSKDGRYILVGRRADREMTEPGKSDSKDKGRGLPVWLTNDLRLILARLSDHAVWVDSPGEIQLKVILRRMLRNAAENVPGNLPSNLQEILQELRVPTVDWRRALRSITGRRLGGSRRTYSRRNRRYRRFGVKGKSHHARDRLLVMVDTSGSISLEDLQNFFTEIEDISSGYSIDLVTFDHVVQPTNGQYVYPYRKGDWRKIALTGCGGTSFINAFQWVDDSRLWAQCNIVLTDGFADWPTGYENLELIWCLSRSKHSRTPPFGDVVHIGGENR